MCVGVNLCVYIIMMTDFPRMFQVLFDSAELTVIICVPSKKIHIS